MPDRDLKRCGKRKRSELAVLCYWLCHPGQSEISSLVPEDWAFTGNKTVIKQQYLVWGLFKLIARLTDTGDPQQLFEDDFIWVTTAINFPLGKSILKFLFKSNKCNFLAQITFFLFTKAMKVSPKATMKQFRSKLIHILGQPIQSPVQNLFKRNV